MGDSLCEFESAGFPCQSCFNKHLVSNHQVNKQKLISINQMVIVEGGKSHRVAV